MTSLLVIDIGSRSIKGTLLDRSTKDEFAGLRFDAELGNHLDAAGALSKAGIKALETSVEAIWHDAVKQAQQRAILPLDVFCFGTAALRKATNQDAVKTAFLQRFGWPLHVLSGEQEAAYEHDGVMDSPVMLANRQKRAVFADLGGNSTEFSCIDASGNVVMSTSLDFGINNLLRETREGQNNVFDGRLDAVADAIRVHAPELVVLGGSTVHAYAHELLTGESAPFDALGIESQPLRLGGTRPDSSPKAVMGELFVRAITQLTDAPIYVTTRGARHGLLKALCATQAQTPDTTR